MSAPQSITLQTEDVPGNADMVPWLVLLGTAIGALIILLIVRRRIIARQHPRRERHLEVDITPDDEGRPS